MKAPADRPFTALVMAGSRPAGDPLAIATGVAHKALAPIAGEPLLTHVVRALAAARSVGRVVICGIERDAAVEIGLVAAHGAPHLEFVRTGKTPAASAHLAMEELELQPPILITTADHPLLTTATVDEFCTRSAAEDADVTFGMTRAAAVSAAFPGVRRTHYRLRDGTFCGCNLYALLTPAGRTMPSLWVNVEPHRKRPWRMVAMLGPRILLKLLIGRLSIADLQSTLAKHTGLKLKPIELADAAAGFDVDNLAQLIAAEAYLRARRTADAGHQASVSASPR